MTKTLRNVLIAVLAAACVFAFVLAGCSSSTSYTVTFDYNYDGAPAASEVSVESGETVSAPDDPDRSGYMFSGWYIDSDCTVLFDFSAPVTSSSVAYAGWIERKEGYLYVTQYWNYDGAGVYNVLEIEEGVPLNNLGSPERDGYAFRGWYTEPECVNRQSVGVFPSDDISLYALWYQGYVFEAEYTNLMKENQPDTIREFQGFSLNADPVHIDADCSNGYYIGDMYINEGYLYFEIACEEDVEAAEMHLTLGMDYGWNIGGTVTFEQKDYTITVNGDEVSYDGFSFDVSEVKDGEKTGFFDFYIADISLTQGANRIQLKVSNGYQGAGGTQKAMAPLVDCMTIYSPSALTYDPIESNLSMAV